MYDVAIIGAGICGSALAYELSKKNLKICLVEKENDVSMGATRANSAIIHAGYDPEQGTLMAKYNVRGSEKAQQLCEDLDVLYKKMGSLVLAFNENEHKTVEKLYKRGCDNGLKSIDIIYKDEILKREPYISDEVYSALVAPDCAVVSPWEYCAALAEVAFNNGVEVKTETAVTDIKKEDDSFILITDKGEIEAKIVINAAGVGADKINDMVGGNPFKILPNKGEYFLLDKNQGYLLNTVVFQCPNEHGKGVLVAPTVHGNLIVGPNAEDCEPDDDSTTAEGLLSVKQRAVKSVPGINFRENTRNFAGIRANSSESDFIIGEEKSCPGFFNVAGIKSPGLSSAVAIAEDVAAMVVKKLPGTEPNKTFNGKRKMLRVAYLDFEERAKAIEENPLYGRVICRCEGVTEGEIIDALNRPFAPTSLAGVKRRCFAGSGRCQGGFCGPKIVELISEHFNINPEEVLLDAPGSNQIVGYTKGGINE